VKLSNIKLQNKLTINLQFVYVLLKKKRNNL